MSLKLLDNPALLSTLFFPRPAPSQYNGQQDIHDGTIPVDDNVVLGYRLYAGKTEDPLLIYYHGNGEIAADYDSIAPEFKRSGLSLMIIDFRGYGWSTGTPTATSLINDVDALMGELPALLATYNLQNNPRYVMGRSLGSAPAIHMASSYVDQFKGLIVESGFADIRALLARRGMLNLLGEEPDPIDNLQKVSTLDMPVLVIHGEYDQLIPVENAQELYVASPSSKKMILRIPDAGHNNLLLKPDLYFGKIREFLQVAA